MSLDEMLERAREYQPTEAEKEAAIKSFAYGNVALHNPAITHEDIEQAWKELKADA